MAASTTTTKLWGTEDRDLTLLLKQYYRAFAAEEAYKRFFGETPGVVDPEFTYEHWSQNIQDKTKHNQYVRTDSTNESRPEGGVADRGQAKAAIDGANFAKNRNEFRKAGVLSGLDAEYFEEFAVRTEPNSMWEEWRQKEGTVTENWRRDNLEYNTGILQPLKGTAQPIPVLKFWEDTEHIEGVGRDGNTAPERGLRDGLYLFMFQPSMVQSLLNRAYVTTATGASSYNTTSPFYTLALRAMSHARDLALGQQSLNTNDGRTASWQKSVDFYQSAVATLTTPDESAGIPPNGMKYTVTDRVWYVLDEPASQYASLTPAIGGWVSSLVNDLPTNWDPLIQTVMLSLDTPFGEGGDLYTGAEWEKLVTDERNAILTFFGVKMTTTALPDAPEFDNFDQIITDKEVGDDYTDTVIAARQNLTPRDMQCYLLENIRSIAAQRQSGGRYASNYKNVKKISTGGKPALLTNILRHGKNTADIQKILDICPDVYGLLQPYIRIFRVDYDNNGNVAQVNIKVDGKRKRVDAEAELIIPNFLNRPDVASILLGTRGRAAGSGLKSFSWSLDGTQPAEVDNNIKATIQIYFQSVSDFFNGVSQAGKQDTNGMPLPNFLDLIVNSPAIRQNNSGTSKSNKTPATILHRKYEGANFRIKAEVGWARPDPNALAGVLRGTADAKKFASLIEATRTTLFLQCVRHNLDFRQDGTVMMDISYVAGLAGILSSPKANILAPSTDSILESLSSVKADLDETNKAQNLTARQQARKDELLEERNKIIQQDRLIKYKKLLRGLFSSTDSKIYQLPVDINDMLREPWSKLSDAQRAQRAKRKEGEAKSFLMTNPQQLNLTLLGAVSDSLSAGGTDNGAAAFSEAEQKRYAEIQSRSSQFKFVPFMFLGDLIDNVIEQTTVNNNGTKLNFTTFLSDTDMVDPLKALQLKGITSLQDIDLKDVGFLEKLRQSDPISFRDDNGIVLSINIGDIPISVDAFQVWFKDNVIKKDLEKFYLLYFIKKLCADLIVKAFQSDCFGEDLRINQRFDAHPVTYKSAGSPIPASISATAFGKKLQIKTSTPTSQTHNAIVVLPTDSRPGNLKGNYWKDLAVGIHHHHIGAPCGLLKTIKFNRMDQEYLREANIQKEGALGPEQLRELYTVTIEMVGNNLYENGMYIYISPTLMDANKDNLDYLGLHGYYLITSVASKVTSAGFTTTIKALHQAVDFTNNSDLVPEMYDLPPEPPLPGSNPAPEKSKSQLESEANAKEAATAEATRTAAATKAQENPDDIEAQKAALGAQYALDVKLLSPTSRPDLTNSERTAAVKKLADKFLTDSKALEAKFKGPEDPPSE